MKVELFSWEDFKQFNVPPETLAAYCNNLLLERTTPLKLCPHHHDVIRADANWTPAFLNSFPYEGRMFILFNEKKK